MSAAIAKGDFQKSQQILIKMQIKIELKLCLALRNAHLPIGQ